MSLVGTLRLGLTHGARRSIGINPTLRSTNTRLFSSLLTNYRAQSAVVLPRTRFISNSSSPPPPIDIPPVDIPPVSDPSSLVTPETASALDTVTSSVIPALQYGDFAAQGLASWVTPAGWIRWTFEVINVSTGMPWFWTIVAGTALWRLVIAPLTIVSLRETAKMAPHQENMAFIQKTLNEATMSGDPIAKQKATAMARKYTSEHDLNPLRAFWALGQLPIQLGLFFGVQKMCEHVPQLQNSGVSFLPDLTAADPTYILPALFVVIVQFQISLGAKDINPITNPNMPHFMNLFRVLSVAGAFIMSSWPSGLFVSMITTSTLTVLQSAILRQPSVRHLLRIPVIPKAQQGKMPSFMESLRFARKGWNDKMEEGRRKHEMAQRERYTGTMARRPSVTYELPKKMPKMDANIKAEPTSRKKLRT